MKDSITVRAEQMELTRLQSFADAFARKCDLPDDERSRLLIILDELFTNAVTHGVRPGGSGGNVTVTLRLRPGRLFMSFVDDEPAFNPLAFYPPHIGQPADEHTIGGLGIRIVRALVHRARYRRVGGRNYLHLLRRSRLSDAALPNICSPTRDRRDH
jgi:anti-sigma regulatory factor (Ser/Thr protein kinase)